MAAAVTIVDKMASLSPRVLQLLNFSFPFSLTFPLLQFSPCPARVHPTSQAANAIDQPTVASWWFHDTVAARLVVELFPSRVASRLSPGPCSVYRQLQIGAGNSYFRDEIETSSALEALRDALYKSTTTIFRQLKSLCVVVRRARSFRG